MPQRGRTRAMANSTTGSEDTDRAAAPAPPSGPIPAPAPPDRIDSVDTELSLPGLPAVDVSTLSLTEIIQIQNGLSRILKQRFERERALAFTDVVGSTSYFQRFGDEVG